MSNESNSQAPGEAETDSPKPNAPNAPTTPAPPPVAPTARQFSDSELATIFAFAAKQHRRAVARATAGPTGANIWDEAPMNGICARLRESVKGACLSDVRSAIDVLSVELGEDCWKAYSKSLGSVNTVDGQKARAEVCERLAARHAALASANAGAQANEPGPVGDPETEAALTSDATGA